MATFYLLAIFADFISPYSYDNENRLFSYAPPSKIHIVDSKGNPISGGIPISYSGPCSGTVTTTADGWIYPTCDFHDLNSANCVVSFTLTISRD